MFSPSSRSSVRRATIDVEHSTSHQYLNDLEDFDMSDLETLSINEEKPNVEICDEEEVELLVNRSKMFKRVFYKLGKLVVGGCIMSGLQGDLHMKL